MTTKRYSAADPALDELCVEPLWEMKDLLTTTPIPRMVPFRWRISELMKLGERAADQTYDLKAGDVYVIPSWATHTVRAAGGQLDLFVTSDAPMLEALHTQHEEIDR